MTRQQLRKEMRAKRAQLTPLERRRASGAIARAALRAHLLRRGARIAAYVAFDGEVDLAPLIAHARRMGCTVFLPRIVHRAKRRMDFVAQTTPSRPMARSIAMTQPRRGLHKRIDPRKLDVVFAPVVAFDRRGARLGFGGGFYDRTFAFLKRGATKPRLIGVAYAFQEVSMLTEEPWDVPLHAVITEKGIVRIKN